MTVHRLPDDVIRRIAAGEVVDHPASIIKELVENSIDAGAEEVRIAIESGGKSKIVIDDDGSGMNEEDLVMAVQPHTTSKIDKFEDLFDINTFGFRGEAVASIAAVSRMKVETSVSDIGSSMEVNGGIANDPVPTAKTRGTRITVSDLFFNVPARRKFLSSASVETRMVTEMVEKFILSNDAGIMYSHDGQESYRIKKGTPLADRIKKVTGESDLAEVDQSFGGVRIHGYVSSPSVGRKNRTKEIIFVNGRYVRSGILMKAIETGYAEHMKKGEFPVAVVFIDLPPQLVDVNVHPQKMEVKFSDQSRIFGMVAGAVKKALASPDVFRIPFQAEEPKHGIYETGERAEKAPDNGFGKEKSAYSFGEPREKYEFKGGESRNFEIDMVPMRAQPQKEEREMLSETRVLGILKGRYVSCEGKRAFYIVDMHAAHERILYDRFKSTLDSTSRRLVVPIETGLSESERQLFGEHKEEMEDFGFEWKDGKLTGVPSVGEISEWKDLFIETLESFRLSFAQDPRDEFYANIACKAAVKTGERVSSEEIESLLKDLDGLEVWSCPHGRPLVYTVEFSRLDRYFGR